MPFTIPQATFYLRQLHCSCSCRELLSTQTTVLTRPLFCFFVYNSGFSLVQNSRPPADWNLLSELKQVINCRCMECKLCSFIVPVNIGQTHASVMSSVGLMVCGNRCLSYPGLNFFFLRGSLSFKLQKSCQWRSTCLHWLEKVIAVGGQIIV